ncbi:MAG: hypothetical protein LBR64_05670 [Dysgonamonadaceae bacterium]|nr:hypothetical protein [Dysgonamonadaceae bacterium]
MQLKEKSGITDGSANSNRGFLYPRVALSDVNNLFPILLADPSDNTSGPSPAYKVNKALLDAQHKGLVVYNVNPAPPFHEGIYQWTGSKWSPVSAPVAKNGLSVSDDNVVLGGPFDRNTTVELGSNDLWFNAASSGKLGVGASSPACSSAVMEINSSNKGVLIPRMTNAQRENITPDANADGLTIYNTSTQCIDIWYKHDANWISLCPEKTAIVEFSSCEDVSVKGVYDMDKPVDKQTGCIIVPVKVVQMGKYSYTAEVNGITYSGSGTFVNFGYQEAYMYPSAGTPTNTASGDYAGTITVGPVAGGSTANCSVTVKFVKRSQSHLKIVNIPGNQNYTSLISGSNYNSAYVYAHVGDWLKGSSTSLNLTTLGSPSHNALYYSGTQSIEIVNVPHSSTLAALQMALEDASIVYAGACTGYDSGFANLIQEWHATGKGILLITGDKRTESTLSDVCGYYIEDGSSAYGTLHFNKAPQIFTVDDAPYKINSTLSIGYSGTNCGYISSNKGGAIIMTVTSNNYPSCLADTNKGIFIFGDKFGSMAFNGDTYGRNYSAVLTDIFAWALRNCPIYN